VDKPTWIVVADSSRARIVQFEQPDGAMTVIRNLVHPASRLKDGELLSDRPGRVQGGPNGRKSGAKGESDSAHSKESDRFARALMKDLRDASASNTFGAIVLMAPPRFLGRLREHLGSLESFVADSVAVDLSGVRDLDLPAAIDKLRLG